MITLLKGPLLMTVQIFAVGTIWSFPLTALFRRPTPTWQRYFAAGAAALITGLSINLVIVLLLGEAGVYRSPIPEATVLTAVLAGAVFCRRSSLPGGLGRHLFSTLPAAAVFFLAVTAVTLLPARGEWVLGGWDPGVYVNEGLALERSGTFHPPDLLFAEELGDEGRAVYTRSVRSGKERFPGVAVDLKRRAFTFEFFRLTPAWIALNGHLGGERAALRASGVLFAVILGLFAFLTFQAAGGPFALFASFLLAVQPVFLYHSHVPASEMLHLTLLISVALLLPHRSRGRCAPAFLALTIFLLMLNRFSFLPFAGFLLIVIAWGDLPRPDRLRVLSERLFLLGACGAGWAVDVLIAPVSLRGWKVQPTMVAVFTATVLFALLLDGMGTAGKIRKRLETALAKWGEPLLFLGVSFLVAAVLLGGRLFGKSADSDNFARLVPFVGLLTLLGAAIGIIPFFFTRRRAPAFLRAFVLFLLAVTALLMTQKWIVDIYPWATRRYLAYTVPAVVLLAAWLPALLWGSRQRRALCRACAVILLLLLTIPILPRSRHAWSRVEHQGAARVVDSLAEQTADGDVIVVDSPRWGTPLALIHGRDVLDGKHLWRFGRGETMEQGLRSLRRLGEKGRRIRFLTSTERGLAVYPRKIEPVTLDWESGNITLEEIIHSPRASDYVTRRKEYLFRLYTWTADGR